MYRGGANRISEGTFIAERHPASALLGLPIVWLFASLPAILVHDHQPGFQGLRGILSLMPPVLIAGLTLFRIRALVELVRSHRAGARTYGIVIDNHNLVSRRFYLLPVRSCLFIPRAQIDSLLVEAATGHPSKYGRVAVLWVRFTDGQGRTRSLKLAEGNSHGFKPSRLREMLLNVIGGP